MSSNPHYILEIGIITTSGTSMTSKEVHHCILEDAIEASNMHQQGIQRASTRCNASQHEKGIDEMPEASERTSSELPLSNFIKDAFTPPPSPRGTLFVASETFWCPIFNQSSMRPQIGEKSSMCPGLFPGSKAPPPPRTPCSHLRNCHSGVFTHVAPSSTVVGGGGFQTNLPDLSTWSLARSVHNQPHLNMQDGRKGRFQPLRLACWARVFSALETTPPPRIPQSQLQVCLHPRNCVSKPLRDELCVATGERGDSDAFWPANNVSWEIRRISGPETVHSTRKHGFAHLWPVSGKNRSSLVREKGRRRVGEGSEKGRGRVGEGSEKGRRRVGEGSAPFSAVFAPFWVFFLACGRFFTPKRGRMFSFSSAPHDTVAILARPPPRS